MDGFPAGLIAGSALVLLVALTFVGTPDGLEEALGALDAPLVGLDQVLVGHFLLFKDDRAWIGSTVYAPGVPAAIELDRHLDAYRPTQVDRTPEPVRSALCAQGGCSNETGGQRLLSDLGNVTLSLQRDLNATLLEDVKVSVRSHEQGLLHIAVVEVAPRALADTPNANASVKGVRDALAAACGEVGILQNATQSCGELYVLHSVHAVWNMEWDANVAPAPPETVGVLGPLSWASGQVLPDGRVLPPLRGPVYLPMLALAWVVAAVLASVLLHYALEGAIGNAALPLPPLATLLGVILLFVVDANRGMDVHLLMGSAYGLLLLAYLAAYYYLDLAGVHFLTLASTILIGLVGLAALVANLKDLLLGQPMGLITTIYNGQVTTDAADLAAKTLFTVGGACVAVLLLSAIVAWRVSAAGRRVLADAKIERLLRTPGTDLWDELDALEASARAGALPWGAYASITARAYRKAKTKARGWWWRDPMPFVPLHAPLDRCPALAHRPAAAKAIDAGAPADPLDALWDRHVNAAREARRFRNIRVG